MIAQLSWSMVVDLLANSPRVGPMVPPVLWNLLYGWLPGVARVSTPTAPLLYPTLLYLLAIGGVTGGGWRRIKRRRARRTDLSDVVEPPEPERRRPASNRPHGSHHRPSWQRDRRGQSQASSQADTTNRSTSPTGTPDHTQGSPPGAASESGSTADTTSATGATADSGGDSDATTASGDGRSNEESPKDEAGSSGLLAGVLDRDGNDTDQDADGDETAPTDGETTDSETTDGVTADATATDVDAEPDGELSSPSPSATSSTPDETEADTPETSTDMEAGPELEPEPEPKPDSPSESDSTPEPDPDPTPGSPSDPDPDPDPDPTPKSDLEPRTDPGSESTPEGSDMPPEAMDETPSTADEIAEAHQRLAAADSIEWDLREPKVGEQYTKTLYAAGFPDYPKDGFLHQLFELTDAEFDATFYFKPRNQNRTRERLKRRADDLKADAKLEQGTGSEYLATEGAKVAAGHNAMERGVRAFTTAAYFTVRGDSVEDLRTNEAAVRRVLSNDAQADLDIRTTHGKQDVLLQSASPLGPDIARRQSPDRYSHIQLSGGIGAVLSSCQDPSLLEEGGIEIGRHAQLQTPVVVDPFQRENGFSKLKIADQGGGKSHSSKMEYARMITQRDDCIGIVLEPLGNWTGVAEATDAEHIVVGGEKAINPLEIQAVSNEARQRIQTDESPLNDKKTGVIGWLRNYFELRDLNVGDRLVTLENALNDAYHARGFRDGQYETFANDSPTVRDDLIPQLRKREENPHDYAQTEHEATQIREDAAWLRRQLRPFVDGQFEALGGPGDVDLSTSDNIYLDLGQEEGSEISDKAALTMQLLIDLVYQRATRTQKKVVFPIDEFHYVTESAVNLEFLETLLRHHRHHEISPWFITQTVDEFLDNEIADRILKLTTMTQFHHIDTFGPEQAEPFDLSPAMQQFVRNAAPGSPELGYSDSLIGIDGEWRRMEVVSLPDEARVIEYDPTRNQPSDLPGRGPGTYSPTPAPSDPASLPDPPAPEDGETPSESVAANGGTGGADGDEDGDADADDSDSEYLLNWGGRS